jgi:hypothetical protein
VPTSDPHGLKKSKAELFLAIAKLLGVLSVALIPALVAWVDAKTKATLALTAAASERATNEKAYAQLIEHIADVDVELAEVRALCEKPTPASPLVVAPARTSTRTRPAVRRVRPPQPVAVVVESHLEPAPAELPAPAEMSMQSQLPLQRPAVNKADIEAARESFLKEAR